MVPEQGGMGDTAVVSKRAFGFFIFSSLLQMVGGPHISVPDRVVIGVGGILQSLKDPGALQ